MDSLSDPGAFDGACRDVVELVTGYLERTLPEQVVPVFEAHLDECPACVEIVAQFRATISVVGTVRHPALPATTQWRMVLAFRALLGEPGGAS